MVLFNKLNWEWIEMNINLDVQLALFLGREWLGG